MEARANLFIVGAARCGTTSLYEYLDRHPDIFMSSVKEPHFFAENVENLNQELYKPPEKDKKYHTKIIRDKCVYASLFEEGAQFKIRGEASPSYLWEKNAAKKIYNYNNKSKIIIILRDPVKRSISQYQMDYSLGLQKNICFLQEIQSEFKKEKKIWGLDRLYLDLGFYYQQVSRYYEVFPSSQILIINFESLKSKPRETLTSVFKFLEVSENYVDKINFCKVHNNVSYPRYLIIGKLKKNKLLKRFLNLLGDKKDFLKLMTYKKGYNQKIIIDKEAHNFLKKIYKEDLEKLNCYYKISFS